jgi:hypothetical protein
MPHGIDAEAINTIKSCVNIAIPHCGILNEMVVAEVDVPPDRVVFRHFDS